MKKNALLVVLGDFRTGQDLARAVANFDPKQEVYSLIDLNRGATVLLVSTMPINQVTQLSCVFRVKNMQSCGKIITDCEQSF